MDESDKFLLIALERLGLPVPKDIQVIQQLNGDELKMLVIGFLEKLGKKTKQYKNSRKAHAYRISNLLCDELRKLFGGKYDIGLFIQPNPTKAKKLVLQIISKMSNSQEGDQEEVEATLEERIFQNRTKMRKTALKQWLQLEWILPAFHEEYNIQERTLHISNIKQRGLIQQFAGRKKESLLKSIGFHLQEQRYLETSKKQQRNKFSKKGGSHQKQYDYSSLQANNLKYWKSLNSQVKKKKEKRLPEKEEIAETAFELNVMFKQEEAIVNPVSKEEKLTNLAANIEEVKAKNKEEVEKIQKEIGEKINENDVIAQDIDTLEEGNQEMEENIEVLTAINKGKQKKAEDLHQFATILENPEESEQQLNKKIDKINTNIDDMNSEWEALRDEMLGGLRKQKRLIDGKKQRMEEQRAKILILENDIENLGKNMRKNKKGKERLVEEIENMPKEANRMKFVNKINDIHGKLQKTKENLAKSEVDIKNAKEQIIKVNGVLERSTVCINNILNLSTKDSTLLKIRTEYKKLLKDQQTCVGYFVDGGQTQLEIRSLQIKNDLLSQKNYAGTITKISQDLEALRQENAELLSQQQ